MHWTKHGCYLVLFSFLSPTKHKVYTAATIFTTLPLSCKADDRIISTRPPVNDNAIPGTRKLFLDLGYRFVYGSCICISLQSGPSTLLLFLFNFHFHNASFTGHRQEDRHIKSFAEDRHSKSIVARRQTCEVFCCQKQRPA